MSQKDCHSLSENNSEVTTINITILCDFGVPQASKGLQITGNSN